VHRSSAEASEIEKEVNKHKRYQNTGSIDKNYDPEQMKRQMLQVHLQKLVTQINEKEKLFLENEKQYSKLQQQLHAIDKKTSAVET